MAIKHYLGNIRKDFTGDNAYKDLGFGTKGFEKASRLINRDGTFNVVKKGRPMLRLYDAYNFLITMPWALFFLLVIFIYLLINIGFALIFMMIGIEELSGIVGKTKMEELLDAFFFSTQTLTTLGYGRISPVGFWADIAAAAESLIGLLGFALTTGLLYGRFSRPQHRLVYSEKGIIAPYRDITAFEFRLANTRRNELVEIEVQLTYTMFDKRKGGRIYENLKLEREKVNFMSLSWTIVHPIDEESPLYGMSREEFYEADGEFLVLIKAFDEAFSQTVYARTSYKNHEVAWGRKFRIMYEEQKDGRVGLHLNQINETEEAVLNQFVSKQKD